MTKTHTTRLCYLLVLLMCANCTSNFKNKCGSDEVRVDGKCQPKDCVGDDCPPANCTPGVFGAAGTTEAASLFHDGTEGACFQ